MAANNGLRNWPWEHVLEILRAYGQDIGRLAKQGDKLARAVRERYQYAHDHPSDMGANLALRDALEDYLQRELRDAERRDLASRFGHRLDSLLLN